LLDAKGVAYRYREYTQRPLSQDEIRRVLAKLRAVPGDLLRSRDPVFRELGLTGSEAPDRLVALMAEHPTLLERPIGIRGDRAVVGRPVERLLELLDEGS